MVLYKAKEAREEAKEEANKANKEAEAKKFRQQAITKKIMNTKKTKREAKLKRKEMNIIKKAEQIYYNTKIICYKYPDEDMPKNKRFLKDANNEKYIRWANHEILQ
jgi:hypothetical protein